MVPVIIYSVCIGAFVIGACYVICAYYYYICGYKAAQKLNRETRYRLKFIGNMSIVMRKQISGSAYWFSRGWMRGDNDAED